MARQHHTRNQDRAQYRGGDHNPRSPRGGPREGGYGPDGMHLRDDRYWQGPDEWNSARSRWDGEWNSSDRPQPPYRNGASNQADGAGQEREHFQGNRRTVAPTNSYDREENGPYNGHYFDRARGSNYGDTRGDNYGGGGPNGGYAGEYGGGFNGSRFSSGRPGDGQYDRNAEASYFGPDLYQDMERGRSDGRYAPRGDQLDSQSNFTGRGPKGWTRSDERIHEELNEQLERHPAIDASEIEVKVQAGEVTLSGTTADRRMKRMAEDVAEQVAGVREVQNRIRLQRAQDAEGDSAEGAGAGSDRRSQSESADQKQSKRSGQTS